MDTELSFHIESCAQDLVRTGIESEEAMRRARIEFGSVETQKDQCRRSLGLRRWDELRADLRYGIRTMRRSPGFTLVAVLSLALGIGANTAIFTLIDAVLLKMLPVKNPQELVLLQWTSPAGDPAGSHWMNGDSWQERGRSVGTSFSYPTFQQVRASNQAFSEVFAFAGLGDHLNVLADGEAALARGQAVSGNYFSALGIHLSVGRTLEESDDQPGASAVCVISDSYWKRRFGGDRSIAGKAISIAGIPFTIIGVAPPEFFGVQAGSPIEVWVPLATQPLVVPTWDPKVSLFTAADHWWVLIMGRLKPDVPERQAAAGLDVIFKQSLLSGTSGFTFQPGVRPILPSLELTPGNHGLNQLRRQFSRPLFVLMGIVGLVLLIACANVANLLLARATSRQKEIGVRLSLGASRGRLIRQLLTESALLACVGGALGLLLAQWGSRLLVTFISRANSPLLLDLSPDPRVLTFTATACLLTGLLFGLAPAFRATHLDQTLALKQGAPAFGGGPLRLGLAKSLVVAQAALSLVLLSAAGLFVRTLANLENVDPGFDTENLLLFGVNPAKAGYKASALNDFYSHVQQRVAALPGVISVTASLILPLGGSSRESGLWIPGYAPKLEEKINVHVMPAGPNFFATMKIPLLRGRDFTERDNESAPKVAVVNEMLVKRYFGNRDPIGQRIGWNQSQADMEIVGVAKDAKYTSLRQDTSAIVYHPFRQARNVDWMYFDVRTARDPHAMIPDVRRAVASIDPHVPPFGVETQTEQVDELLMQERLFVKLSSFFGLLALLLACIGLYGLMSYSVVRRTREIGVRMALGAQPWSIISMVVRETLALLIIGAALGIPASLLIARFSASVISDLLYGLRAADPATVMVAGALMVVTMSFAGILPARRASRVDPVVALRWE